MSAKTAKQDAAPVVDISNLSFRWGDRVIYDDISLQVLPGKITAVMGPSGTGKTTLLRLIGGELQPAGGAIHVCGQAVNLLSRQDLYKLRKSISILFQNGGLFTDLNVIDNVSFPLQQHTDLPADLIRDLALLRLESVGLRAAATMRVDQLSGGMARRVALARAIILDPKLMMYDEPFTGQDPITRGVLLRLIKVLNESLNLTSILVTHDVEEALAIADYLYILAGGQVIAKGTPQALEASDNPSVQQFLKGQPDGPVAFNLPTATSLTKDLGLTETAA